VLKTNGYEVSCCNTVTGALAIFAKEKGRFDLALCDIILPDGRGTDLALELRRRQPSLDVLLVSGYADAGADLDLINRERLLFLPKPYMTDDFFRRIYEVTSKRKRPY
jgi:DNA-binding NtrC family response regulator